MKGPKPAFYLIKKYYEHECYKEQGKDAHIPSTIYTLFEVLETSTQQRKQITEYKGNLQNGRKYLQTMYLIRG